MDSILTGEMSAAKQEAARARRKALATRLQQGIDKEEAPVGKPVGPA